MASSQPLWRVKCFKQKHTMTLAAQLHWIGVEKGNYKRDNSLFTLFRQLTGNPIPISEKDDQFHFVYWFKPMATKLKMIKALCQDLVCPPYWDSPPLRNFLQFQVHKDVGAWSWTFRENIHWGKYYKKHSL